MDFFVRRRPLAAAGIVWVTAFHPLAPAAENSGGRKPLYYTCAMHPWVRESKPGPCPVCGMNLTPVYANEAGAAAATGTNAGEVTLEAESISVINVQTDAVERRPLHRTIHFSGQITGNSWQTAWFEFTAYQRDLEWLKIGQTLQVTVEGVPDKTFTAQIKLHGIKPFADTDFDMMTSSTTMRADFRCAGRGRGPGKGEMVQRPSRRGPPGCRNRADPGGSAQRHHFRGTGALVYVGKGNGRYAPRTIELGRLGNDFAEVTSGLKEGEKVVTNGNVLIDSEAQLTSGE